MGGSSFLPTPSHFRGLGEGKEGKEGKKKINYSNEMNCS